MTRLVRTDGARFVIKRDSAASDWIARATGDPELREARLAHAAPRLPAPARLPHVGVARDGDRIALLMPDLADVLLTWEQAVEVDVLNRVLAALAALHREPWFEQLDAGFPWCDLGLRLNLLT